MPVSANGTHIVFNDNSTQAFGFTGPVAAANITGTITGPQIAPATITAPNIAPGVIPSGGLSGQIFASTTPGPGSWTAPPTTTRIRVTVVGAGGGNGPPASPSGPFQGGAGGGTGIRSIPVVGGTPYPYTIGAGGTGAGGTTSFGSPASVSATGGAAGAPCVSSAGGTGSAGDINVAGDGTNNSVIGAFAGNPCPPTPPSPFGYGLGAGGSSLTGRKTTPGVGNPFGGGGFGGVGPGAAGGPGGIIIEF